LLQFCFYFYFTDDTVNIFGCDGVFIGAKALLAFIINATTANSASSVMTGINDARFFMIATRAFRANKSPK